MNISSVLPLYTHVTITQLQVVTVVAHITDLKSVFAVTQVFFQDTNSILFVLVTLIANQDIKLDN